METSPWETTHFETISPAVPPLQTVSKHPKQGTTPFLCLFVLASALGAAAKYAVPTRFHGVLEGPNIWTLEGVATLLAAVATSIVLHEAGHLVVAILVKFEVLGLALGPIRASRSNGAWHFRFSPRSFFSGSVSAVPRTTEGWRGRMLCVVAAGPLATLVTGVAAGALVAIDARLSHPGTTFLSAITQLSVFIFVLGLIPNRRASRVRNDARLLLVLRHDSKEAREILRYHMLTRLELASVRPREYPEQLMRELAQTNGRPDLMLFSAHKIVLWALDRGQLATASAWDQRCLELSESCQPAARNLALAHSACMDVLVRDRSQDAHDKFAEVDWQTLSPTWLMHRARATYYLTEGNVPECLAEVSRAQRAFPTDLPYYAFEGHLLRQLHRKALKVHPPALVKQCAA